MPRLIALTGLPGRIKRSGKDTAGDFLIDIASSLNLGGIRPKVRNSTTANSASGNGMRNLRNERNDSSQISGIVGCSVLGCGRFLVESASAAGRRDMSSSLSTIGTATATNIAGKCALVTGLNFSTISSIIPRFGRSIALSVRTATALEARMVTAHTSERRWS